MINLLIVCIHQHLYLCNFSIRSMFFFRDRYNNCLFLCLVKFACLISSTYYTSIIKYFTCRILLRQRFYAVVSCCFSVLCFRQRLAQFLNRKWIFLINLFESFLISILFFFSGFLYTIEVRNNFFICFFVYYLCYCVFLCFVQVFMIPTVCSL